MLLELCSSNAMADLIYYLQEEGHEVITYPCLDRCERCVDHPYVYADGMLVEGPDTITVIKMISLLQLIEE